MTAVQHKIFSRTGGIPGRVYLMAAVGLVFCAVAAAFFRTGESQRKFGVQGKIIVDGKPLAQAVIVFVPISIIGAKQSGAEVTNGQYRIEQINGLVKGRYRVEFYPYTSPFSTTGSSADGKSKPTAMPMPEWYSGRPRLEIDMQEEQLKYDFLLKTGAPPQAIQL